MVQPLAPTQNPEMCANGSAQFSLEWARHLVERDFSFELFNLADEIQVVQGFDYIHSLTGPMLYVTKGQVRLLPAETPQIWELPKILKELNA